MTNKERQNRLDKYEMARQLQNSYSIVDTDNSSIEIVPTRAEIEKETVKEIIKMFYEYDTEQDLKNAIAVRFGLEGETWR